MRYYYTDPLKAFWMAKEFGFEFYAEHTLEQMQEYDLDKPEYNWFDGHPAEAWRCDINTVEDAFNFIKLASDKIYLKAECYELLKPQAGDLVYFEGDYGLVHGKYGAYYEMLPQRSHLAHLDEDDTGFIIKDGIQIIQRDGKAFFTPEVEINIKEGE